MLNRLTLKDDGQPGWSAAGCLLLVRVQGAGREVLTFQAFPGGHKRAVARSARCYPRVTLPESGGMTLIFWNNFSQFAPSVKCSSAALRSSKRRFIVAFASGSLGTWLVITVLRQLPPLKPSSSAPNFVLLFSRGHIWHPANQFFIQSRVRAENFGKSKR